MSQKEGREGRRENAWSYDGCNVAERFLDGDICDGHMLHVDSNNCE